MAAPSFGQFANIVGLQSRSDMEDEMKRRLLMSQAKKIADQNPEILHRALSGGGDPTGGLGGMGRGGGGGMSMTVPPAMRPLSTGPQDGGDIFAKGDMGSPDPRPLWKIQQESADRLAARNEMDYARDKEWWKKASGEDPGAVAHERALELAGMKVAGKGGGKLSPAALQAKSLREAAAKIFASDTPTADALTQAKDWVKQAEELDKQASAASAAGSATVAESGPKRLAFYAGDQYPDTPDNADTPASEDWKTQITKLKSPAAYQSLVPGDNPYVHERKKIPDPDNPGKFIWVRKTPRGWEEE